MEKLLLTVEEAAERLGIGRTHVYDLIRRGELLSIQLGRSRRVPVRALDDFASAKIAEAVEESVGG